MRGVRRLRERLHRDIRAKLLLAFGLMAVFGLAAASVAIGTVISAYEDLAAVTLRGQQFSESAVRLALDAERMAGAVRSYLISDGAEYWLAPYREGRERFTQTLADMEAMGITPADSPDMREIRQYFTTFVRVAEDDIAVQRAGFPRNAILMWQTAGVEATNRLSGRIEQLAAAHRAQLQQIEEQARAQKQASFWAALVVAVGTVIAGMVMAARLATDLVEPLRALATAARAIETGELGVQVPQRTADEVGQLAGAINLMSLALRESQGRIEATLHEVERQNQELASLNEVASAATSSLELDTMLHHALHKTLQGTDFEVGAISLLDEETGMLYLAVAHGVPQEVIEEFHARREADLLSREAVIRREPVLMKDMITRLRERYPGLAGQRFRSGVSVPLTARGVLVGALTAITRNEREITARDRALLLAIGQHIGLAVHNARLYEKAQQLAVSEERNRLARELHDSVTQQLFSMSMMLQALPTLIERNPARARERAERVYEIARTAQAEMRALIFELRPATLEEEGLAAALRKHIAAFERREGVKTHLEIAGEPSLSQKAEQALFRIAQEALNNVSKHAHAQEVTVRLEEQNGAVRLTVTDDGVGIAETATVDTGRRTLGMSSMRERADALGGYVDVRPGPEGGTVVTAVIPVAATPGEAPPGRDGHGTAVEAVS